MESSKEIDIIRMLFQKKNHKTKNVWKDLYLQMYENWRKIPWNVGSWKLECSIRKKNTNLYRLKLEW